MRTSMILLVSLLTGLVVLGCGEEPASTQPTAPTLDSIQQTVFEESCNFDTCHSANGGSGGLVLESDVARDQLVDVEPMNAAAAGAGLLRVKPGSPDESLLLIKLEAGVPSEFGDRMPRFSSGLPADQLAAIRTWIDEGAQE